MNTVIHHDPLLAPHLLAENRFSPSRSDFFSSQTMSGRKRKASEEPSDSERMSTSPTASPSMTSRTLPASNPLRTIKRTRTSIPNGKPLALPRLLETLSADAMRQLLQNICNEHPQLQHEIVSKAPKPSIDSTLSVLSRYEQTFREAFPLGNRHTSDYTYNRVRQHLQQLIDALREFTPHYLPPNETQDGLSLTYLDAVTHVIHRLPDWDTYQHQRHKNEAYDEIAKAWALVIKDSAKRAGGFHLQFGGWDRKLMDHNAKSGGKMEEAISELTTAHGLVQSSGSAVPGLSEERASIRQQLFSGTYGQQQQLGVGPGQW